MEEVGCNEDAGIQGRDVTTAMASANRKGRAGETVYVVRAAGTYWVVDMFVAEGIITPGEVILELNTLLSVNRRLPKKLIEDKIQQLEDMLPVH